MGAALNADRLAVLAGGWSAIFMHLLVAATDGKQAQALVEETLLKAMRQALEEADPSGAPLTPALVDVALERRRQIEVEGYTAEHDANEHLAGEFASAGAAFAISAASVLDRVSARGPTYPLGGPAAATFWPPTMGPWKPRSPRRDLVRAAALLIAELDRMDRTPRPSQPAEPQKGAPCG